MAADHSLNRCMVSGHRLAYHRSGNGEPILLVHGVTTYSFIWRRVIPLLESSYDVISIDLLGCGESDKPLDVDYSICHQADLLSEFVAQLGITRFHYAGHDIGGGIGQILAVRDPECLYDLTLINTVAYDFWPVQPVLAMRTPILRQLAIATLDIGTLRLIVKRGVYHKERVTADLVDLFGAPYRTAQGRKAFLRLAKCLNNRHLIEIEQDLAQLRIPVLIIRGDADSYLSAAISIRLDRSIPDSRLVHIPTGGHFIQEDEPEQVVAAMVRFFERGEHAKL